LVAAWNPAWLTRRGESSDQMRLSAGRGAVTGLHVARGASANLLRSRAPVAQGIEHRPPEAGAQVRILPGAPHLTSTNARTKIRALLFVGRVVGRD
jgi:hypothetical protein